MRQAMFAAGCFWGVQFYFDQVPGVVSTTVGYSGGHTKNPTYEDVCYQNTGHAEVVLLEYDPQKVVDGAVDASVKYVDNEQQTEPHEGSTVKEVMMPVTKRRTASVRDESGLTGLQSAAFRVLLRQFFYMHDPTQLNRQGPDTGDQYRSAIFTMNDIQTAIAQSVRDELQKESKEKIVTEITRAGEFYAAEEYHQKYTQKTGRGMCHKPYKNM